MVMRAFPSRLNLVRVPFAPPVARRGSIPIFSRKLYHGSAILQTDTPAQSRPSNDAGVTAASMMKPTGNNIADPDNESRNAAFLGEADSDDNFEKDIEINPEAHRHDFNDVKASGLHGQTGEGDEPIERERKPKEALDASHSAYLGESDSDEAHEADREAHPENYRHEIEDASPSGIHGQAGEGDEPVEKRE